MTEPRLDGPDSVAWRRWLAANHATEREVWLVYRKGGGGGISYDESVDEALCFGWIDGLIQSIDDTRYMRRFTPRRPGSMWSASNKRRINRLVVEGRLANPGRLVLDAAKADGSWDLIPDAERDWSMPVELGRALKEDGAARAKFDSSSPSDQRRFLMWVASAKRSETRERRAARAVEMLVDGEQPT